MQIFYSFYIIIEAYSYKLEDLDIERIEKLEKQDIKTKLLPTLKDRNPIKSNVDEMKQAVREYLKDILIIDDNTKQFYDKFQKGIYEPELLFNSEEIIERIKEHTMIIWKLTCCLIISRNFTNLRNRGEK